jgi:uncharacterized protein (DUF1330 family)
MRYTRLGLAVAAVSLTGIGFAAGQAMAPTPKGYVIAEIQIKDASAYKVYAPQAAGLIAKYGGRYLVRGGNPEAIEGAAPAGRVVVLEFDSVAKALAFERSPDYREAAKMRQAAAQSRVFVVEGATS